MLFKKSIASIVSTAIKIFFIGLMLQFIAHTFVTYTIGRDNTFWKIVRMWKELWIIGAVAVIASILYHQSTKLQLFWKEFPLKKYSIILVVTTVFILFLGTALTNSGLTTTIMSLRYSMTGFVLFIIGFVLAIFFVRDNSISREKRYIKAIKYMLIG